MDNPVKINENCFEISPEVPGFSTLVSNGDAHAKSNRKLVQTDFDLSTNTLETTETRSIRVLLSDWMV